MEEPTLERAIFDLDLTLYRQKDPEHANRTSFYETALGVLVTEQITLFIADHEGVDAEKSAAMFEEAKANPVGPSVYFAERYGMTRLEYFAATWGEIDVDKMVDDHDARMAQSVLGAVIEQGVTPVLLTAGPRPWARKVMARLGIEDAFRKITYGEEFEHKREVFAYYAADADPVKQVSVGDDYAADIEPAVALGMHGFHIDGRRGVHHVPGFIADLGRKSAS